jgi:hypothetical protein
MAFTVGLTARTNPVEFEVPLNYRHCYPGQSDRGESPPLEAAKPC